MYIKHKGKKLWVNLDAYDYDIDYGVLQAEIQKVADTYVTAFIICENCTLDNIFTWENTPQGDEFWGNIWVTRSRTDRVPLRCADMTVISRLNKYFGDDNGTILNIKNKSTKYHKYEFIDGVLKGYKADGTTSCLKLHTFLKNRDLPEEIIIECMKILKNTQTYDYRYTNLVDGYDNTEISSCMQNSGSYYERFEPHGSLLQAYLDNKEVGRAVVWTEVEGLPDGCLGFMDRIYPSDNHIVVEAFKNYGRKHHLMYKQQQSYSCDRKFIWCDAEIETKDLEMHIGDLEGCCTPYMDTFRYYSGGVLYNDDYRDDYTLDHTDGEAMMEPSSRCECCGASGLSEDDLIYSDYLVGRLCEECYNESHPTCECCGASYHRDRMNQSATDYVCDECMGSYCYIERDGYYIPTDDAVYCEDTQDYININDSDCAHSDHSSEYSYTRTTVEVTDSKGDTEEWFEDEAEEHTYKHSDGEHYTYEEETNEND